MSTEKWNGMSTYQMREALRKTRELEYAKHVVVNQLDQSIRDLENSAKEEVLKLLWLNNTVEPRNIYLCHSWECPESPTDHCIYRTDIDRNKDQCIFCLEPLDRG